MKIEKNKEDEVLEKVSEVLKEYIIRVFGKMEFKKDMTDKEAENLLQNVGLYLMKKNKILK